MGVLPDIFGQPLASGRRRGDSPLPEPVGTDTLAAVPDVQLPSGTAADLYFYASQRAPKGGVTVGGRFYPGGRFIPGEVLAKASPEEKQAVASGESRGKPIMPDKTKPKKKKRKKRPLSNSVLAHVRRLGGLDPKSLAFLAHYEGVHAAIQDGINLGLFRTGGRGLDQIAQELEISGLIRVPDGVDGTEYVLQQIRVGAMAVHAEATNQHQAAEEEYWRAVQEAEDYAKLSPAHRSAVAQALRSGEAAGVLAAQNDEFGTGDPLGGDDPFGDGGGDVPFDTAGLDGDDEPADDGPVEPEQPPAARMTFTSGDDLDESPEESERLVREVWGKLNLPGTPDDIPKLVGAEPGAEFEIWRDRNRVSVIVRHPKYESMRSFRVDEDGVPFVYNASFVANETGTGLGADVFSRQAAESSRAGFGYLYTEAAGSPADAKKSGFNGYYTWPRFGYDQRLDEAEIPENQKRAFAAARAAFPHAESVLDIFETAEGRKWWKENGTAMEKAKFNLDPQSRSMRVLGAYMEEKKGAAGPKKSTSPPSKTPDSTPLGTSSTPPVGDQPKPPPRPAEPGPTHDPVSAAGVDVLPNTSEPTRSALSGAFSTLNSLGLSLPRVTLAGDDRNLGTPAESRGVLIRVNPQAHAQMVETDRQIREKYGRPFVVDSSLEGVLLHEMTHSRVFQLPQPQRDALIREADRLKNGAKSWLSMRAEADADEFLSEIGVAYIRGMKMPPEAQRLAEAVWGPKKSAPPSKSDESHRTNFYSTGEVMIPLSPLFSQALVSGLRWGVAPLYPQTDAGLPIDVDVQDRYGRPLALSYEVRHAPPGGVTVAGKQFRGGQFIPAEVMAEASPEEREAVEKGESRGKPVPPPSGSSAPATRDEPIMVSKNLSPAEQQLERDSQVWVRENYPALRDAFLRKNAVVDPDGNVRSVTLNTDEWREFVPGYNGTNAGATHEAASWLNKQLTNEMMRSQVGKGNNTFLVLAGGGGSGKGTATGDFFAAADYPIVLDQVSDRFEKLEGKLGEAQQAGYRPAYVFVDRPPEDAAGGIVGRALNLLSKGKLPRTVNLEMGLHANIASRKTAIDLLKRRPDIEPAVIDNRGGRFKRRLITDRAEAIQYLEQRLAEDQQAVQSGLLQRLQQDVIARRAAGEIPEDMVTGFLGAGWRERLVPGAGPPTGPEPRPATASSRTAPGRWPPLPG